MRKFLHFLVVSLTAFLFFTNLVHAQNPNALQDPGTCTWKNNLPGGEAISNCNQGFRPGIDTTNMANQQCKCFPAGATGAAFPTTPTPTPVSITGTPQPTPPCAQGSWRDGKCTAFKTAIGTIDTEPMGFIKRIFGLLLGLSGGVAVILIIVGGYQLMTSQGNKEAVQSARDRITSAIVGLLFLIFSLVILQVIGVDILSIPGLSAR